MAKAEFGTAKYASKQLKARGLQKLRFYCQVCHKQCRDDNGFQSHIKSPSHVRKISNVSQSDIDEYTKQFEAEFLRMLRLTHGEKKIEANKFYNEFIQDKNHTHMNATRFTSLTRFIQHLGKASKIRVHGIEDPKWENDDADMGHLLISYIDYSQESAIRNQRLAELERNEPRAQEVKTILLQRQIQNSLEEDAKRNEQRSDVQQIPPSSTKEALDSNVTLKLKKKCVGDKKKKKKKNKIHKNVFEV
ncbi:RTS2 (YOR077W) [Zygosaccharomyces parabailii]|uniref:BN860_00782g1_1 n=1 Tax=Zygosaccharomyces bailii (strain CLIB 213 / ATCC 58445 / CBS 680 / BCRC 21525 / NBRC 1098 / NCYC 1416 / NRRL Y-2227) TaxID=1333698 RepID=A0A8J2SYV3_ZYGB2|nr:RTS2 (YOR077W) [Zygosaccharomyces parabailii]CDF87189.1 BN860_00782g1_1 [Zygosaccharomyces bailii CLIB 213]CDH15747.1 related to RTS2-Basic zinc-finger protein,involved in UV response and DNA replication [Zygosaccharomyces bailii ISA1307]